MQRDFISDFLIFTLEMEFLNGIFIQGFWA